MTIDISKQQVTDMLIGLATGGIIAFVSAYVNGKASYSQGYRVGYSEGKHAGKMERHDDWITDMLGKINIIKTKKED